MPCCTAPLFHPNHLLLLRLVASDPGKLYGAPKTDPYRAKRWDVCQATELNSAVLLRCKSWQGGLHLQSNILNNSILSLFSS